MGMENSIKTEVQVKIFTGFLINGEFDQLIKTTSKWKEEFEEVPFEGKRYLGIFLNQEASSVKEIKMIEEKLQARLLKLWPKHPVKPKLIIFPQIFIP